MLRIVFERGDQSTLSALADPLASLSIMSGIAIIDAATEGRFSDSRIRRNIVLLNSADEDIRRKVLNEIDYLTTRLTLRPDIELDEASADCWASLLRDAGEVNSEAQEIAAEAALGYAIRTRRDGLGPIVVASFPIVYRRLRDGEEPKSPFNVFFFIDWDRCRVARGDLVDAFLHASWPPSDLLLAASEAEDTERILERLTTTRQGRSYLQRIRNDLSRVHLAQRIHLERELDKFQMAHARSLD
jgi:hypothetical protein